ncbi:MAG: DUF1566 domain-containing protein [Candidatus Cloacimonetes bacterium]|nr:DUF1566 domain-containing protein [Candidatus Cloacimonadota bacterium]
MKTNIFLFTLVLSAIFIFSCQNSLSSDGNGKGDSAVRTRVESFSEVPPVEPYKIGDIGPAGGLIFYDKGIFSDGWRYLESALLQSEAGYAWGGYGYDIFGTETAVGTGKRNTEIIIAYLSEIEEYSPAAQVCDYLYINGYTDWFLPSYDELTLMYENLALKGLGGFVTAYNGFYWSSSQYSQYYALSLRFSDGWTHYWYPKYDTCYIRAARAF